MTERVVRPQYPPKGTEAYMDRPDPNDREPVTQQTITTGGVSGSVQSSWVCFCTQEHRPTINRAWCFACSEWCYPKALCVRGELVQAQKRIAVLEAEQANVRYGGPRL